MICGINIFFTKSSSVSFSRHLSNGKVIKQKQIHGRCVSFEVSNFDGKYCKIKKSVKRPNTRMMYVSLHSNSIMFINNCTEIN